MNVDVPGQPRRRTVSVFISLWSVWLMTLHFSHWPLVGDSNVPHARTDSAVYAYAGELLRTGGTPYLSYWDHKPPLIHWLNAGGLAVSGGELWGVWWLSFLALLSAMGLGYVALRRAFGPLPAVVGMTFFTASLDSVLAANYPETYALSLQWLAVFILLRFTANRDAGPLQDALLGWCLGIVGGLQLFLRQNLVGSVAAVGVTIVLMLVISATPRRAARFASGTFMGVMVVAGGITAYLATQQALGAFWDQAFSYNFVYSTSSWSARLRVALSGVKQVSAAAGVVLPVAGWLLAVLQWRREWRAPGSALLWMAVLWLPIELALASLSGRDYWSYFMMLLAPLSFLTALLASRAFSWPSSDHVNLGRSAVWISVAVCAAMAVMPITDLAIKLHDRGLGSTRMRQVAVALEYLQQHHADNSAMFVWGGAPDLYHLTGHRPASRYLYVLPLLTPGYATEDRIEEFVQEIRSHAPVLIIDGSGGKEVTPSLSSWNPAWRSPDPANPQTSWLGRSYWTMTPALERFYDYVHSQYHLSTRIGPLQWSVYVRNGERASHDDPISVTSVEAP